MADERQYFCLRNDNCRFPTMTAEQILAAIAEATGNTPTSIDDAFITKIKEINGNTALKFWVGTQAQYNALTPESDTYYIIKDDTFKADTEASIKSMQTTVNSCSQQVSGFSAALAGKIAKSETVKVFSAGTTDLTAGASELASGEVYFVYE